ncbi:MAG: hypothetical protein IT430_18165 [Phycisphaerales bacterium]|nr:hypothetical protein [Phycisphaerales bacterium]
MSKQASKVDTSNNESRILDELKEIRQSIQRLEQEFRLWVKTQEMYRQDNRRRT